MGKISKRNLVFAGLKMVVAGVISLMLSYFLEGAIHH